MLIEFKFKIDQKVVTPLGEDGIVSTLGVDAGGNIYYIKTKSQSEWFKEKELKFKK